MPTFNYAALKADGSTQHGILDADSAKHARQLLRHLGFIPLQLVMIQTKRNTLTWLNLRKKRVTSLELTVVTRQLATLLSAALPLEVALHALADQTEKKYFKSILFAIRNKILEGHSFAESLRAYPHVFPDLYCATIQSGEQTGKLDSILNRLADYLEKHTQMKQKILQALIYPTIMLLVTSCIISFLLAYVVPKIIAVFSNSGQSLPAITLWLLGISNCFKNYGIYFLLTLLGNFFLARYLFSQENFFRLYHQFLLKIPFLNYMIRTINTARYARTLGILYASGISILEAMRVASSLITNLPMREMISAASIKVREGMSIHAALKQTGYFSPLNIHLIASGETSGQLAKMLERAADSQDETVSRLIAVTLSLFEPLMILIMGIVVLFIVLALLLPIFQLDQLIG